MQLFESVTVPSPKTKTKTCRNGSWDVSRLRLKSRELQVWANVGGRKSGWERISHNTLPAFIKQTWHAWWRNDDIDNAHRRLTYLSHTSFSVHWRTAQCMKFEQDKLYTAHRRCHSEVKSSKVTEQRKAQMQSCTGSNSNFAEVHGFTHDRYN